MPTLKELREERFMTTRELIEKTGLSSRTIDRIEHGIGYPYFKTIKRLAVALGVDPGIIEFKPKTSEVAVVPFNNSLEALRREFEQTIEAKILEALETMNKQTDDFQFLFTQKHNDLGKRVIANENMLRALLIAVMGSTSGVRDKFVKLFNDFQERDDCDPVALVTKEGNLHLVDRDILKRRLPEGGR